MLFIYPILSFRLLFLFFRNRFQLVLLDFFEDNLIFKLECDATVTLHSLSSGRQKNSVEAFRLISLNLGCVLLVVPLLDRQVYFLVHPLESHIHLVRHVEQHLYLVLHADTHSRRLGAALERWFH